MTHPERFLIWARDARGDAALFWGPDRAGYTTNVDKAGRYTHAEYLAAVPESKRRTHVLVPAPDIAIAAHRVITYARASRVRQSAADHEAAVALAYLTAQDGLDRMDVVALVTLQFSDDYNTIHLVRQARHGTPGPTLCGIDRFPRDSLGRPTGPGWSVGGGCTGGPIRHVPCPGCAETAQQLFPGLPIKGSVGGREVATILGRPIA